MYYNWDHTICCWEWIAYCYDKYIKCVEDNEEPRVLQGKKKDMSIRMVKNMQEKHGHRNECVFFVMHISSEKGKEVEVADVLSIYLVLQQF